MPNSNTFLADIKAHPDRYYIIHYSSEHLFDQDIQGTTPRITSVVVCHYATGQLQSFAIHTAADRLGIARENIADHYDAVELEMLRQLYEFIGTRTQNYWIHWNMRSVVFGFEHLSHRYQVLTRGTAAPVIPVEHRINLNDVLREKFGELCPGSAPVRQILRFEERRISGSS